MNIYSQQVAVVFFFVYQNMY